MVTRLIDVANIRFTQEHVYDSFNENKAEGGSTVELMGLILSGKKTPSDLPLIRVAPKGKIYWCVDNRRLFVYKHCQLGEIPVQVFDWKDSKEFELKWKNGLATRALTSNGRRIGILQRTDVPFPASTVAEPALSKITRHMGRKEQKLHDAAIASLKKSREASAAGVAAGKGDGREEQGEEEEVQAQLLSVLGPAMARATAAPRRPKKGRKARREAASTANDAETKPTADRDSGATAGESTAAPQPKKRARKGPRKVNTPADVEAAKKRRREAEQRAAEESGGAALTVTLGGDEGSDDEYAVEVFAPQ
eukprot:gnl/TRDRNA2_/TRDRNA2_163992_c0_seq1.p1 gnl/TRDRNA2_/TRDRNA2_163992_c0~~gnl/TRDRNA2_/TRDRNA2_163992_c0_seq1.p1  ORF type:complete len:308 (-),score=72.44 gnl/TRDRNA2_/TRDRNA2_163992_c0_seq1:43-966(-)